MVCWPTRRATDPPQHAASVEIPAAKNCTRHSMPDPQKARAAVDIIDGQLPYGIGRNGRCVSLFHPCFVKGISIMYVLGSRLWAGSRGPQENPWIYWLHFGSHQKLSESVWIRKAVPLLAPLQRCGYSRTSNPRLPSLETAGKYSRSVSYGLKLHLYV